jgi:hypothetical protein
MSHLDGASAEGPVEAGAAGLAVSWAVKAIGIKPEHANAKARRAIFETRKYMRFSSAIENWKISLETAPFADHFPVEVIWLLTDDLFGQSEHTTNKRNIGVRARDYFLNGFTKLVSLTLSAN